MKFKIIIGLMFASLLTGCSADSGMSDYKGDTRYFRRISKEINGRIIYDTRTGVEYWMSSCAYSYGNLTLLVDAEGKPLIYDRSEKE